jgi:protein SDA1
LIDKGYRSDAKSVAIVALGCFHPVTKVQSASLHFFLGNDEGSEDSDDESDDDVCPYFPFVGDLSSLSLWQTINVRSIEHKREIKKKTRSGDKKIRKMIKTASKVRSLLLILRLL